eukprot:6455177-Amphidinium_carterae.1
MPLVPVTWQVNGWLGRLLTIEYSQSDCVMRRFSTVLTHTGQGHASPKQAHANNRPFPLPGRENASKF